MGGCGCPVLVLTALLMLLLATLAPVWSAPLDTSYPQYSVESTGDEAIRPAEALLIRRLLDDFQSSQVKYRTPKKRTCLFNGGMSHSCDYKDMMGAMDEAMYLNSMNSPGRRRRRAV